MRTPHAVGLCTAVVTALALVAFPATPSHAKEPGPVIPVIERAPAPAATRSDTLIVTFDHNQANPVAAATDAVEDAAAAVADADVAKVTPISPGMVAVTLDEKLTAGEQAELGEAVEDEAGVRAAEPNYLNAPSGTVDPTGEPLWAKQWDLGPAWGIKAAQAWAGSTGAGAVVGVVDTGIAAHPDLSGSSTAITGGNLVAGYDFVSLPSMALDGNGRDADPTDRAPSAHFHGTHVAGTIGARLDGKGVVGAAPNVRIQPLRALGEGGGTDADIMAAMRWGAGLAVAGTPANPTPVDVLNLSIGGAHPCTTAMQLTVNAIRAKGVSIVVSAGNDNTALSTSSPANCSGVIRVTATGATGTLAGYSNHGTASMAATVAAPGGSGIPNPASGQAGSGLILSTWSNNGQPSWAWMAGTSMAAPHVSGVVALLRSVNKSLTPDQVTAILRRTAAPLNGGCEANTCGAGIVDALAAVREQAPAAFVLPTLRATAAPRITGTATIDQVLTGHDATWTPSASLRRQWFRDGAPITGATAATYRTTPADVGHDLTFAVTAGRPGYTGATAVSGAVRIVPGTLKARTKPSVTGTRRVGHTLTGATGRWTPSAATTRAWMRDGVAVPGATGATWKVTDADRGHTLQLRVTATRAGYTTVVAATPVVTIG